jgi:hypothetical protein
LALSGHAPPGRETGAVYRPATGRPRTTSATPAPRARLPVSGKAPMPAPDVDASFDHGWLAQAQGAHRRRQPCVEGRPRPAR